MAANTRNADILFKYQVDNEKLTLKRRETVDLDKAVRSKYQTIAIIRDISYSKRGKSYKDSIYEVDC